ncbi:GntR family transcriptional regulator [Amycolatopsis sp. NBC_00345]|uniref:GntR family transcriptional regulator n=1 Tax=Amycolatopsis sp. NBC_00345 TaxID=2975955 RepID=UPI002E2620FC
MTAPGKIGEVRARLLDLVDLLPEGAALPPERELAGRWQVARMTLRRAMDDLVLEDLLVRRQGTGTFTSRPKVSRRLAMTSFSEEMRRRGMRPASRTLELRRRRGGRARCRLLRIPAGDVVVEFVRLRLADDAPMALERTFVADRYVPGLSVEDLDSSWYELLATRYGTDIVTGTCRLDPVLPDPKTAEHLGIPVSQPCLRIRGISLDARGRVMESCEATYRGDRYAITADLRRPNRTRLPGPRPPS